MRYSLQSNEGDKLFVAAFYEKSDRRIFFTHRLEDACSYKTKEEAMYVAYEIQKKTGDTPRLISTKH